MRMTIALLAFFVSAILMAGWYAFIPGILLALLGGFLGIVYLKCQLCIRREMSNAKAPVMSEIGAALNGLRELIEPGAAYAYICIVADDLSRSVHPRIWGTRVIYFSIDDEDRYVSACFLYIF